MLSSVGRIILWNIIWASGFNVQCQQQSSQVPWDSWEQMVYGILKTLPEIKGLYILIHPQLYKEAAARLREGITKPIQEKLP